MFEGIHSTIKPYSLEMSLYHKKIISSSAVKPVIPVWKTKKKTADDKYWNIKLNKQKQIKLLEEYIDKSVLSEELQKGKHIDVYVWRRLNDIKEAPAISIVTSKENKNSLNCSFFVFLIMV